MISVIWAMCKHWFLFQVEKVATKDDLLGVDDSSKSKDILLLRYVKFGKSNKISTWFLGEWILARAKCEEIKR